MFLVSLLRSMSLLIAAASKRGPAFKILIAGIRCGGDGEAQKSKMVAIWHESRTRQRRFSIRSDQINAVIHYQI